MFHKFEAYLGKDVPIRERLLYIALFLSSVCSLIFVAAAVLLRIEYRIVLLYASVCVLGTVLFFLLRKCHRVTLLALIFITFVNNIVNPVILILSRHVTVEIPLYMLTGLFFAFLLLEGKLRIIDYCIQVLEDLAVTYYVYVLKDGANAVNGASSVNDYVRVLAAIFVSGLICGLMVLYRNYLLEIELLNKEEAGRKAEEASYAKDIFLVNVSHEIRTPLNAIIGTTDMLLESEAANHIKEMAFNISNSSHALLSITTDLLDFSRMNIDSLEINDEKYDLSFMLNDIVNLMSVRLLDSNVEFFVNIDKGIPRWLIGDCGKLRQIIINMLSNAIKYTKEGYMQLEVSSENLTDDEIKLKIKVFDTGIGIKEDNLEAIFEPLPESGEITDHQFKENGLGLALCKKLALKMNGKIWAESVYGEGSQFYFECPQKIESSYKGIFVGEVSNDKASVCYFADSDKDLNELTKLFNKMSVKCFKAFSDAEFIETAKENKYKFFMLDLPAYERIKFRLLEALVDWRKFVIISTCNYSYLDEPFETVLTKPLSVLNLSDLLNETKNYTIRKQTFEGKFTIPKATVLVVDDNLVNLEVAAGLLQRYECKVLSAASGREGLICLENEQVNMVFLDYMMPDMDGIDTLKEIRKLHDGEFSKLPVICLSANVVSGAKEMFLNEGFDDYLSKPIEIPKLEKAISDHIDTKFIKYII